MKMELVKTVPRKYQATKFDKSFVDKYGLIKYPMLHSIKHLTYLDNHPLIVQTVYTSTLPTDKEEIVSFDREDGTAKVYLLDGNIGSVEVPWKGTKMVWEKHKFLFIPYEKKVTKPVYDFDAPELHNLVVKYYCNGKEVHDGDWIVTNEDGHSQVYSPDEFKKQFTPESKETINEE